MLETVAGTLRGMAGIRTLKDFGTLHEGRIGFTDSATALRIETWRQDHYVAVTAILSRGRSYRRTSTVKWPYGDGDPRALAAVVEDFATIAAAPANGALREGRTAVGRFVDRLWGRGYLGEYFMRSPVPPGGDPRIRAVLERWRGETSVMLSDLEPHRPPIYAQVPQPAFPAMIAALEAFSHG